MTNWKPEHMDAVLENYKENVHKMTNADRIRSMSDEELAEFLNKFEFCNGYAKGYCNATDCKECAGNNDDTLEWLKSEEISK